MFVYLVVAVDECVDGGLVGNLAFSLERIPNSGYESEVFVILSDQNEVLKCSVS